MKGQSIRALVQSASNDQILTAGTLRGVYRSEDGGVQWKQISPLGSMELHEVESIAVDPDEPGTIYAGTWHLPWKTTDGGATWHSIKKGLIDDSDVFSIIIDPKQTNIVYTSACSGNLPQRRRRRALPQGTGHTFDRTPDSCSDAGPGRPQDCLRRHHGRFV